MYRDVRLEYNSDLETRVDIIHVWLRRVLGTWLRRVIDIWLRRVIGTWLRRVFVSGFDLDQYVRDTRRKKKKTQNIMYAIRGLIMINHD